MDKHEDPGKTPHIERHRLTVGAMLMAISVLHQLVGVGIGLGIDPNVKFVGRSPLAAMAKDGGFASVGMDPWRLAITWFLLWGFALMLIGYTTHQSEVRGVAPTRGFGLGLGALCVLGIFLMPASGFWLGLVPVYFTFRRSPRRRGKIAPNKQILSA
jgi:Family of unknown function (DUF6463)